MNVYFTGSGRLISFPLFVLKLRQGEMAIPEALSAL